MKYIRTKDGQIKGFEVKNKELDLIKYLSQFANYKGEYAPIKQANTIEELCDEIVVDDKTSKNCKPFIYYKDWGNILNSKVGKALDVCVGNGAIYGAIWTDKGLIFVAKMNDKGELELL